MWIFKDEVNYGGGESYLLQANTDILLGPGSHYKWEWQGTGEMAFISLGIAIFSQLDRTW